MEERVEGGGTRPRPLIRRSSVTRWASRRGANRAASRYGRPRGGGEVAYRECGYRSSAVSLETRRWLLDFPSPFRFSTARGFRPRAFIRHGARFRSIRRFRSPFRRARNTRRSSRNRRGNGPRAIFSSRESGGENRMARDGFSNPAGRGEIRKVM